jgi:hypothetical protein
MTKRWRDSSHAKVEGSLDIALNVLPNDWSLAESRLKAPGLL